MLPIDEEDPEEDNLGEIPEFTNGLDEAEVADLLPQVLGSNPCVCLCPFCLEFACFFCVFVSVYTNLYLHIN